MSLKPDNSLSPDRLISIPELTKNFKFAKRTGWALNSNPLMASLEELRKRGVRIYDLSESNPTRCGFKYPARKILSALSKPANMEYFPSSQGLFQARKAISDYYQKKHLSVGAERILLTSSTSEAYSFLFRLLVNSGERILVPRPSYPLFQFLGDLNDAQLDYYPLVYDHEKGWTIDLEALKMAVRSTTRAIILVNPNNPTGSFVGAQEITAINKICKNHNIALISDEVFLDYAFGEQESNLSLADNNATLTFILGGVSKCLGLPQMKLSWIAANGPSQVVKEALERLEIISDTFLSVSTPSQNSLQIWMQQQRAIQKEISHRIIENRKFMLNNLLKANNCRYLRAQGGWYAILELPDKIEEDTLALELLEDDHVFVHPGYFFDFEKGSHLVLSLLPQENVFREGLIKILRRL